jgi:alpha-beta hydrolase superfamily lysophospholipase
MRHMNPLEVSCTPASDGTPLTIHTWPATKPRGVLQLTHGMGEHALHYDKLARKLNAEGRTLVAQDHRGHGASAESDDLLGAIGSTGWQALVDDIGTVLERARATATGPSC